MKRFCKIFPLFYLVFITQTSYAQLKEIDSLSVALNSTGLDTARINILNELSFYTVTVNKVSALEYGEKALELSQSLGYIKGEIQSFKALGNAYNELHNFVKAQDNFLKAITLSELHNLPQLSMGAYNGLGNIHIWQGNYERAISDYQQVLEIIDPTSPSAITILQNLAQGYSYLGNEEKALTYLNKANKIRTDLKVDNDLQYYYHILGAVYYNQKDYEKAINTLNQGIYLLEQKNKEDYFIPELLEQLAIVYIDNNNILEGRKLLDKAYKMAKTQNLLKVLTQIYLTYSKLEEADGNFVKALDYNRRYHFIKDSLTNSQRKEFLEEQRYSYELEQVREKLNLATRNEEISQLKNERQETIIIMAILFIVIVVGAILALALAYQKLKNQNKKSLSLNRIIQEQNKEILLKNQVLQQNQKDLAQQNDELRNAFDELRETQSQLVQSEKMVSLGVLTAGIAHEINNPVNFITSGITGLKKALNLITALLAKYNEVTTKNFEEKLAEIEQIKKRKNFNATVKLALKVAENIDMGARRAASIIKELRTFSRVEENEFEFVNIHDGIESTLVLLKSQFIHRITITKKFGKLPLVQCNAGRINQVFMNLIANAIQAIPEKGSIIITTKRLENTISIAIADTGVGIPSSIIEKVVEPFFTTKETGKGTGLGLSITNSIIKDHHGELLIETSENVGTTITIILPITQEENQL